MLTPSIGFWRDAVDHDRAPGCRSTSRMVGTMSMTWWNCQRMPPLSVMWPGQEIAMPLPRAAEEGRNLLGPFVGRVEGPGPRHGHVVVGVLGAPGVVEFHLVGDRQFDAVELQHLARRAVRRAFGGGAIVAADVDDERVVELAHVLDRLDHAADLVVGVGEIGGIDLGLADEELLFVGGQLVPVLAAGRRARASAWRPAGSRRVLLVGEDLCRAARSSPCRTGACR